MRGTDAHSAGGQAFLGHPRGLYLVSFTELWERFSYYGMLGLLVLFLTDSASHHGFAWNKPDALKLYGIYTGLVFAVPALGGWISARYLGERRCIFWGGIIVATGHLLLGGPVYFPNLLASVSGWPVAEMLTDSGLRFDELTGAGNYLREAGFEPPVLPWLTAAYYLKVWSFLGGLALIVVGTGLIKPSVSSIINWLYRRDDPRRNEAFGLFMVCIYLGSFAANFVAGTLGETLGWHYGFSAAAIGMASGILTYWWKQEDYLGEAGKVPPLRPGTRGSRAPLKHDERARIKLLLIMATFTILYAVAFYQKGGLLNLYTREHIDRNLLGFEVPITWLLTISTGTFILLTPVFTRVWARHERRGRQFTCIQKLAAGLGLIALGYLLLTLGDLSRQHAPDGRAHILWIVATYVCFGLGDIMIWPPQIAAAASLSPDRYTSLAVGAWYLTIGIGTWITGYIGALSYQFSPLALFSGIGLTCILCAAGLWLGHRALGRLAHGAPL